MQQQAEVRITANTDGATEKLDKLEAKAKKLREAFAEAFRKGDTRAISDITRQLNRTQREIDRLRTNAQKIERTMNRLNEASPKELQQTIRRINDELSSGRVKRGSKEWQEYVAKLHRVQEEMRKVKAEMSEVAEINNESFFDRLNAGFERFGVSAAGAIGAFAGLGISAKGAIDSYSEMQAEEKNVIKYTGMTAGEVDELNKAFRKLDTSTTREQLNRLAQESGRLGKKSVEDVLGYSKAADQVNVSLDDLGDGATQTLSKLSGIFGIEGQYGTEQALLRVGSVINDLSQNCSASAPYLAEFSSRIGGIAAQSKMTISQVMAFAAVLDTQNLAVEASSTALGQLITKLYQDPAKIAKAAGLNVKEFATLVKTDMNSALIALFEHLNKFGGMESLAGIFESMGTDGATAIPVLAALSGHIEELKNQQIAANAAFAAGTSITNEFEVQNTTVQAGLEKSKKGFSELAISLGEQLVPAMSFSISASTMLMQVVSVLVSFLIKNREAIISLTAAITTYYIALHWAAIRQKALTAAMTAYTVAAKAVTAVQILATAALALLTGNITKAAAAWRLFNIAIKTSPIGIVISVLTAAIGLLGTWIMKNREAAAEEKRLADERRKEMADYSKGLGDIGKTAAAYASRELSRLKTLYDAATNLHKSQKKRVEAAKELQRLYPNTFSGLSTEAILAGKAAESYLALAQNIKEVARAEAARDKIKENIGTQLDLEAQNDSMADEINEKERLLSALEKRISVLRSQARGSTEKARELRDTKAAYTQVLDELSALDMQRAVNNDKIAEAERVNSRLAEIAEKSAERMERPAEATPTGIVTPPSESDQKKHQAAARAAAKAAREALKADLEERRADYTTELAQLQVMYYTGEIDYAEYCEKRRVLEQDLAEDIIKIHEQHKKIDIAGYAEALKAKADLGLKQQEESRKKSLKDIEAEHRKIADSLTAAFFNPSEEMFRSEQLLHEAMFREDERYLKAKAEIYAEGSEERAAAERELQERIAEEQIRKKKETAEALAEFEKNYRNSSGSERERQELDLLDRLHAEGLISESEYRKAVSEIRRKSRDEDIESMGMLKSEWASMAIELHDRISDLMDSITSGGENMLATLSKAAESAFALMGAALSQYTAYANAERDLELSRTEQRYEKEIAAAGKNEKKKARLEKQREEELAGIKSKYNNRAMKIEIAQAVAQTALAAITAYASASKVNWLLGPVAAAMATAAGAVQIATIKKQHEAEAAGYYDGGFTARSADNRKEVGVVHANEFVANHKAVASPVLAPVLQLIDHAQRTNTVGSLTSDDVSRAIGIERGRRSSPTASGAAPGDESAAKALSLMTDTTASARSAIDRLIAILEGGIEAEVVMDGERGLYKKYKRFEQLKNNPKR